MVRTVLAYQRRAADASAVAVDDEAADPADSTSPWDLGQITDDALVAAFKPASLARARGDFQQGLLVELRLVPGLNLEDWP